nr:hypothetical protein CFP56_76418 [Quercus suber]
MYRERLNDSKVDSVSVWTDRKRSAVKAKKIDTAWCYNSRRAEREDPVSIHSAGRPRTPSALLSTDPRLPLSFHVCFRDTHCCLSRGLESILTSHTHPPRPPRSPRPGPLPLARLTVARPLAKPTPRPRDAFERNIGAFLS